MQAGFDVLVEAGYQPEIAYYECLNELKLIVDLLYQGGYEYMRYSVSDVAEYGDLSRGIRVVDDSVRERMRGILEEIRTGAFAKVTNSDLANVRAYAVRNGTRLRLVLVNVSTGSRPATVHLGGSFGHGEFVRLSASSLTTQTGITFGGHFVGKDGTFAGTTATPLAVAGSDLSLTLPSGSATVVTLTP